MLSVSVGSTGCDSYAVMNHRQLYMLDRIFVAPLDSIKQKVKRTGYSQQLAKSKQHQNKRQKKRYQKADPCLFFTFSITS